MNNEELQPLKKQPRAGKNGRSGTQDDVVYAHIFDVILEQRLAPGTKLSEEALGEIFGVSRTIIRRALSRLAHEGVVLLPGSGFGPGGEGFFRIALTVGPERLREAIVRLGRVRAGLMAGAGRA